MPNYIKEVYAGLPETRLYNKTGKGKRSVNCLLMGTWLGVRIGGGCWWKKRRSQNRDVN